MSKDNGGPAFPEIRTEYDESSHSHTGNIYSVGGMTLRDYFAAKAMQGILSNSEFLAATPQGAGEGFIAMAAYSQADAMLKERAK